MFYIFVRIHSIQTVDDVISAETERSMSLIITAPTLRSLSHGDAQLLLIWIYMYDCNESKSSLSLGWAVNELGWIGWAAHFSLYSSS